MRCRTVLACAEGTRTHAQIAAELGCNSVTASDEIVRDLVAKRRRRPVTPTEMAGQLGAHFPSMSAAWLARSDA